MGDKPPVASVVQVEHLPVQGQEPEVNPDPAGVPKEAQEAVQALNEEAIDDKNIFEDPTPPQALEGKLSGLEPLVGTPQTTLVDAVSAGTITVLHKYFSLLFATDVQANPLLQKVMKN